VAGMREIACAPAGASSAVRVACAVLLLAQRDDVAHVVEHQASRAACADPERSG